jgi:hypothetical protein
MDLKYPQWQQSLAEAILEFNPQHLREKVQRAEEAIAKRIEELALEQGEPSEILTCPKGRARRTGGPIHCIGAGPNETNQSVACLRLVNLGQHLGQVTKR